MKEKTTRIDVIRSRKKKWIEHVLRGNGLLKGTILIEGRIEGKRPRGRRRIKMLDEMKERARDMVYWRT